MRFAGCLCLNAGQLDAVVTDILEAVEKEKAEEAKKRKRQDEAHGAGAPVCKLKRNAHRARKALG